MKPPPALDGALAAHRPGHALPAAFALDPSIHAFELEVIWRASWVLAGVAAEVRRPGDFFRFDLGDHSVVIVRDADRRLHALHNTCRHRGMAVCSERAGAVKRWVCPYHQWSYSLDGSLLGCGGMEDQLERSDYGLLRAPVTEVGGLVFVWLGSGAPGDIAPAARELAAALAPQGLGRAKVAHRIDYDVSANWKLVWENNRECWHCHAGHPEYIQANFDAAPDDVRTREAAEARARDHARALATAGTVEVGHPGQGLYPFPGPGRWWSANRTPLAPGFVTESIDGAPVAPLMGDYRDYDVGTLRVRALPSFWCHASADHAVLTRLCPSGPELTQVTVWWLVDEAAMDGRDYDLARLLPFWRGTSEQDWALCERNHAGVRNPAFRPGPYSHRREYNVLAFVDWYLERLRGEAGGSPAPPARSAATG